MVSYFINFRFNFNLMDHGKNISHETFGSFATYSQIQILFQKHPLGVSLYLAWQSSEICRKKCVAKKSKSQKNVIIISLVPHD